MSNNWFISILLLVTVYGYGQNPWQQDKGEVLLSPYVSSYHTSSLRSSNGEKINFSNNGSYKHVNPKVYFSLPVKDYKLNLFGNIPFLIAEYRDNFTNYQNQELSDIEIGLRKHLKKIGKYHYLMGSLSAYVPVYSNNKQPFTGLGKFGTEVKLHLGGNFEFLNPNKNFHKVELGLRLFFPNSAIQYRLYLSQGYKITNHWIVLGEIDMLISKSSNSKFSEQNTQFVTNFDLVKTSISIGYELNKKISFFVGGFHDVWNRNTSIGKGIQVFSVIKI